MLKGFREFVLRGNVVDLAVGVVIGAAFNSVVQSFTDSFLNPVIRLFTGGAKMGGQFRINGVAFTYGDFVTQVITFLLSAVALYLLVVVPMNTLARRRKDEGSKEPEAPSEEVRLLGEIRDALTSRAGTP